jgi:hypothetical protein
MEMGSQPALRSFSEEGNLEKGGDTAFGLGCELFSPSSLPSPNGALHTSPGQVRLSGRRPGYATQWEWQAEGLLHRQPHTRPYEADLQPAAPPLHPTQGVALIFIHKSGFGNFR